MSESKKAILEANEGKEVTVVLGEGGSSSVFNGILRKEGGGAVAYWTVTSARGIVSQSGTPVPVPETLICFPTEQLGHLIIRLETQEEALKRIQESERDKSSGILNPSGGLAS
jgi:hypothetical protein